MGFSCAICSEALERNPATNPGDVIPVLPPGSAKVSTTPCGHVFHSFCITKWMSGGITSSNSCPCCRKQIPKRTCLPLFPDSYDDSVLEEPSQSPSSAQSSSFDKKVYESEIQHLKQQLQSQRQETQSQKQESETQAALYQMQCEEYLKMKRKYETEQQRSEAFMVQWKRYENYKDLFTEKNQQFEALKLENKHFDYIQDHLRLVEFNTEADLRNYAKFPPEVAVRKIIELKNVIHKELVNVVVKRDEDMLNSDILRKQNASTCNKLKEARATEAELRGVIEQLSNDNERLRSNEKALKKQISGDEPGFAYQEKGLNTSSVNESSPELNPALKAGKQSDFEPLIKLIQSNLNDTIVIDDDDVSDKKDDIDNDVGLMSTSRQLIKRPNFISSCSTDFIPSAFKSTSKRKKAVTNNCGQSSSKSGTVNLDDTIQICDDDNEPLPPLRMQIRSNIPGVPGFTPNPPEKEKKFVFKRKPLPLKYNL